MKKPHRYIGKMRLHPYDWRIQELENISKYYGINVRKSGGSHVIFDHPKWVELLSIPSRRPIKPIYIKKLLKLIDMLGF